MSRLHIGVVLLTGLLGVAYPVQPAPVRSLLELRQDRVVVQQWDISCAAAALATVLRYQHGHPVSEREVAEKMLRRTDPLRVKVRGGFSLLDLKRYVKTRGLQAAGYLGLTVDDLVARAPVIVPLNSRGFQHFVVFRGKQGDQVVIADPAFGNRTMHVDTFKKAWLKNIGFIVSARDRMTMPNRLAPTAGDFLRPSNQMLQSGLQ